MSLNTSLNYKSFYLFIYQRVYIALYVQEVKDLRNTAVRLVSQLAQIPKSATYFKDVLLAMPAGRREQLQVPLELIYIVALLKLDIYCAICWDLGVNTFTVVYFIGAICTSVVK